MAGPSRAYPLYRSMWTALDWIFPPRCVACGKPGTRWCAHCRKTVSLICGPVCPTCGVPQNKTEPCESCDHEAPAYRCLRSWALFEGPVRKALHCLKYRRDVALGDTLAAQMLPSVQALRWPIDVITPIPLSGARQKERGYNQAGLIARPLALALGLTYDPKALARWRDTRSQVGLTREQRRENVRDVFRAEGSRVRGRTVLLIDDVATTGSTLSSAAESLVAEGATKVYAFTVARA